VTAPQPAAAFDWRTYVVERQVKAADAPPALRKQQFLRDAGAWNQREARAEPNDPSG
jgi:hypothetical protein